jgi:hypothetical protein
LEGYSFQCPLEGHKLRLREAHAEKHPQTTSKEISGLSSAFRNVPNNYLLNKKRVAAEVSSAATRFVV